MEVRIDALPMTGVPMIDAIVHWIGTIYVVLTVLQHALPKDSQTAKLLATYAADIRGVLRAAGQTDEPGPETRKPSRRKKKSS